MRGPFPLDRPDGSTGSAARDRVRYRLEHLRERWQLGDYVFLIDYKLERCLWVFGHCAVQALVDDRGEVRAFTVTARTTSFRPTFTFPPGAKVRRWPWRRYPPFTVTLGRTRFSETVPDGHGPSVIKGWIAARPFNYAEHHGFGNPGYYLSYGFGVSSVGPAVAMGDLHGAFAAAGSQWQINWPPERPFEDDAETEDITALEAFHRDTAVMTYGITQSETLARRLPHFGPHGDEVRQLSIPPG